MYEKPSRTTDTGDQRRKRPSNLCEKNNKQTNLQQHQGRNVMDITESNTFMLKITDQILPWDARAQHLVTSVRLAHPPGRTHGFGALVSLSHTETEKPNLGRLSWISTGAGLGPPNKKRVRLTFQSAGSAPGQISILIALAGAVILCAPVAYCGGGGRCPWVPC